MRPVNATVAPNTSCDAAHLDADASQSRRARLMPADAVEALSETFRMLGDPTRAREKLGWVPTTTLETLCRMMVDADLMRNELQPTF